MPTIQPELVDEVILWALYVVWSPTDQDKLIVVEEFGVAVRSVGVLDSVYGAVTMLVNSEKESVLLERSLNWYDVLAVRSVAV